MLHYTTHSKKSGGGKDRVCMDGGINEQKKGHVISQPAALSVLRSISLIPLDVCHVMKLL